VKFGQVVTLQYVWVYVAEYGIVHHEHTIRRPDYARQTHVNKYVVSIWAWSVVDVNHPPHTQTAIGGSSWRRCRVGGVKEGLLYVLEVVPSVAVSAALAALTAWAASG
jgi:hypothetical protein